MRTVLFALVLAASLAYADTTVPPAITATPELAAAAARLTFEPGRLTLRKEALAAVDAIATWLRAYPAARLEIAVHTDDRGAAEWNLRLSQARAEVVRAALVERKIAPECLVARGYGEINSRRRKEALAEAPNALLNGPPTRSTGAKRNGDGRMEARTAHVQDLHRGILALWSVRQGADLCSRTA